MKHIYCQKLRTLAGAADGLAPMLFDNWPLSYYTWTYPGANTINYFSIVIIQIWKKIIFVVISFFVIWSVQIFAHDTTAQLSWHVQKFVAVAVL